MKFVVYHSYLGCDSGCCAHMIESEDGTRKKLSIDHPDRGDDYRAFAERLLREEFGEEHVADLDWDNCLVCDD